MTIVPAVSSVVMLLLAVVVPWPWFHAVLRFVVSGSAAYMAYRAHASGAEGWAWAMIAVVILYNPLAPLYLDGLQSALDVGAAGAFAAILWRLRWRQSARSRPAVRWRG